MTFEAETVVSIVAYAVLATGVIIGGRAETRRNRELIDGLKAWLSDHASDEKKAILRLETKLEQHAKENVDAHLAITAELGRLGGKIDNGGRKKRTERLEP